MTRLKAYHWPGNVSELESLLERAVVTAREPLIEIDRALLGEGIPLGHYRLLKKIGEGAMGEVWRANHQLLARPAAIKLIRPETLNREMGHTAMERFRREAEATANLSSPHTVELYDFGVSETGAFYYVMELLDGMDLAALAGRGPVPPDRVVMLLRQACRSLAEAHDVGIIHRDIKPANMFISRQGREFDFLKVLDFGMAKSLGRTDQADLTAPQAVAGTPSFMPPELALGKDITPAVDLYAIGCVGWLLLTSKRLFEGDVMSILMAHIKDEPRLPSAVLGQPLPAGLEEAIMACLQKEPADRPKSAEALWRQLGEVELEEQWTSERAERWWEENLLDEALGKDKLSSDDQTGTFLT